MQKNPALHMSASGAVSGSWEPFSGSLHPGGATGSRHRLEVRFQLSKSKDPSSSMSLTSTTSTSSVSLTTEDSASNTTVVNYAHKSKKRPLSLPDASSSKQPKTHLAVESPPDEMSLYKSTRTILSKYV